MSRSPSPALSDRASSTSSSPPRLDPSTLALLDSFMKERDERQAEFDKLEVEASARLAGSSIEDDGAAAESDAEMMDVNTFRIVAAQPVLASLIRLLAAPSLNDQVTEIADGLFDVKPGYVGFQHTTKSAHADTKLLEYDQRFGILARRNFVHYDLDEPDNVPEALVHNIDLAIADPPFLNEVTNRKLATTLDRILDPSRGRLILLTSTSVMHLFPKIYAAPPLGPLHRTPIIVEHAGGIANDFGVWTSWDCDPASFDVFEHTMNVEDLTSAQTEGRRHREEATAETSLT